MSYITGLFTLELFSTLVYVCFGLSNYSIDTQIECPSPSCTCNGISATCSDNKLSYIPRFPEKIKRVHMLNANFGNISDEGLSNLTFNHIDRLVFNNCSIKSLSQYAFMNVTCIRTLQISQNPSLTTEDLQRSFKHLNTSCLRTIALTHNSWGLLPNGMFHSLSRIGHIDLTGNKLRILNCTEFVYLHALFFLNVRSNSLSDIELEPITGLRKLKLGNNILIEIPNWCDAKLNSYFPNLEHLTLDNNFIRELYQIRCLPKLKILSLGRNMIGLIPTNAFSELLLLKDLNLLQAGNPVKTIQEFAFNISSLVSLSLRRCNIHFGKMNASAISKLFSTSPALEILDLGENYLPRDPIVLLAMFSQPKKLKQLNLDITRLYHLPKGVFLHLKYLEKLVLYGNRITGWGNGYEIFGNMTSLKILDLSVNLINIINETSFPASVLSSLETINLSENSFYCVCDQMWFVNWLRRTNVKLLSVPYICVQPPELMRTKLKNYKPTIESCTPWNPLFTVAIAMSSFSVLVIVAIILTLKCHVNIKNFIYLLRVKRGRRQGYIPISNNEDFQYHAFVVYCDEDRHWVHNDFVKRLENEEGFKFCIHHRDFEVGETISGNVDHFLQNSWKVVVIISNAFTKSEWCQWEVDIIQERRRRQGRDAVLIIMLKTITSRHMTSPLRTLLDSTSHLRYKKGVGEDLFWKAVTEGVRKPIGHSPISEL